MDSDTPTPEPSSCPSMTAFRILSRSSSARRAVFELGSHKLQTPNFIAPTSRGAVPHLSHDNLRDHSSITSAYFAFEDFVERPQPPILQTPTTANNPSALRAFTGLPSTTLSILGARRCPAIPTAATNTDHSLAILTSVGFREIPVQDFADCVHDLAPDVVVGIPDQPSQVPGKNRIPKMTYRTELWLKELLKHVAPSTAVLAPILKLEWEAQSYYVQFLCERQEEFAGLALYDSSLASELPEELAGKLRIVLDNPAGPHEVLKSILWGNDLFLVGFLAKATDAGITLDFAFPGKEGEEKKPLGWDMWNTAYATDLGPLTEGCTCHACRRHHRAYVNHLLQAKEMTAWVLLQIHNMHILDSFFQRVRDSIKADTFERDVEVFGKSYLAEMPQMSGEGPRVRGYQYRPKPGEKKNPKGFEKFVAIETPAEGTPVNEKMEEVIDSGLVERRS